MDDARTVWREVRGRAMPYILRGGSYIYQMPLPLRIYAISDDHWDAPEAERLTFYGTLRRSLKDRCIYYEVTCGGQVIERGVEPLTNDEKDPLSRSQAGQ